MSKKKKRDANWLLQEFERAHERIAATPCSQRPFGTNPNSFIQRSLIPCKDPKCALHALAGEVNLWGE